METVRDQQIRSQVVTLDDRTFVNCSIIDCEIFYSGGLFAMHNTRLANCTFTLGGAAQRTVNFLARFELNPRALDRSDELDEMVN